MTNATDTRIQPTSEPVRQDDRDDYAFRFQYADGSAFQIYADGQAFIVFKDGRREQKRGLVINRIPALIGQAAKPRQDRIEELESALRPFAAYQLTFVGFPYGVSRDDIRNSDWAAGFDGPQPEFKHFYAARAALPPIPGEARSPTNTQEK